MATMPATSRSSHPAARPRPTRTGSARDAETTAHRSENRFFVVSGCSGGGKSTIVTELARRGYATVAEPGRRIVRQELAGDGAALPWNDLAAFARRAIQLALADLNQAASEPGWVFFDRGLVDAAAALEHATGEPAALTIASAPRYHATVFLAPPWREIHVTDPERPHGFEEAIAEYRRLEKAYPALGYEVVVLPKTSVEERATFILRRLGISEAEALATR